MKRIFLLLLLLSLVGIASAADPDGTYYKNVVINHNLVQGTLTNFVYPINLSGDTGIGAHAQSDGRDIRIINETGTYLNFELENFSISNGVANGIIWVRTPSLNNTTDQINVIKYGNSSATSYENKTGVWGDGYSQIVLHLNESGTSTTGDFKDSTSNGFNSVSTSNQANRTVGKLGYGQSFNGINSYLSFGYHSALQPTGNFTISGWVYNEGNSGSYQGIMGNMYWGKSKGAEIQQTGSNSVKLDIQNGSEISSSLGTITTNQWKYVTGVYEGQKSRLYIDGSYIGESASTLQVSYYQTEAFRLGSMDVYDTSPTSGNWFKGSLDEVHLANTARSADWIATEYNSQNNNSFAVSGAENTTTPPGTADFSTNVSSGTWPLSVAFTDLSTNSPTSWNWQFGDGSANVTTKNATHTFSQPGTYVVNLTATNATGSSTANKTINVSKQTPVITWNNPANITNTTALSSTQLNAAASVNGTFVYNPDIGTVLSVGTHTLSTTFTPTDSNNYTTTTKNVTIIVNEYTWYWQFGDGQTSFEQNPYHVYSNPGIYSTILSVHRDGVYDTITKTEYINVSSDGVLPVANFTANITHGNDSVTIGFTDLSENATSWYWDFNNDSTIDSTEQNPIYTFTPGTYTVNLTVSNYNGNDSESKIDYITVNSSPLYPIANYSCSDISGLVPLTVSFSDLSSNASSLEWFFGDDINTTLENPKHTFTQAGVYNTTLVATNSNGTSNITRQITVTGAVQNYTLSPSMINRIKEFPEEGTITSYYIDTGGLQESGRYRSLMNFTIPPNKKINKAILSTSWFYKVDGWNNNTTVEVYGLSSSWNTSSVDWDNRTNGVSWSNAGMDWFDKNDVSQGTTPFDSVLINKTLTPHNSSIELDVTDLIESFANKSKQNNGIILKTKIEQDDYVAFYILNTTLYLYTEEADPLANFTCDILSGSAPLTVSFVDDSIGNTSEWFFGDGTHTTLSNPTHTFNQSGVYNVSLVVTNSKGISTTTKQITVTGSVQNYTIFPTAYSRVKELPGNWTLTSYYLDTGGLRDSGRYRSLLLYDIPENKKINKAILSSAWFYKVDSWTNNTTIGVYGVNSSWDASYVDWNNRTLNISWSNTGIDWFDRDGTQQGTKPYDSINITTNLVPNTSYFEFDVTNLVKQFANGSKQNNGILLKTSLENEDYVAVYVANTTLYLYTENKTVPTITWQTPTDIDYGTVLSDTQLNAEANIEGTFTYEPASGTELDVGDGQALNCTFTPTDTTNYTTATATVYINVNEQHTSNPPIANFSANVTSGTAPLGVAFTDSSSENPTAWNYSFGDGNYSNSSNPIHTYYIAGTYNVSLWASNEDGSDTETKINYINVTNAPTYPPVANFTGIPLNGTFPLKVKFTSNSTNATSYYWDFENDGRIDSNTTNPLHAYGKAGNYSVNLTVSNIYGINSTVRTNYISITNQTTPTSDDIWDILKHYFPWMFISMEAA